MRLHVKYVPVAAGSTESAVPTVSRAAIRRRGTWLGRRVPGFEEAGCCRASHETSKQAIQTRAEAGNLDKYETHVLGNLWYIKKRVPRDAKTRARGHAAYTHGI